MANGSTVAVIRGRAWYAEYNLSGSLQSDFNNASVLTITGVPKFGMILSTRTLLSSTGTGTQSQPSISTRSGITSDVDLMGELAQIYPSGGVIAKGSVRHDVFSVPIPYITEIDGSLYVHPQINSVAEDHTFYLRIYGLVGIPGQSQIRS